MSGVQQAVFQNQRSFVAPLDAEFNYVTMLLHGDGTNGAQNNTFLDSGPNTFTITRNGNTTQGSFSPYGPNWSNFFDGTGDYLSVPSNAVFQFGTGDFTIECWFYDTGTSDQYPAIISSANGWQTGSTALRFNNGGNSKFGFYHNPTGDPIFSSTNTFSSYQWYHVAVTRSGTSMKMFVNGVQEASATVSASISLDTTTGVYIGSGFDTSSKIKGYVSNVRVVKGTAVYTTAFTPPTTPLTAITNTSLLTCQSNCFVDNSASPLTITVNGNPSVERFNPFGTATAYDTSVIGGSGYFDGGGDYLGCGSQSAYAFGTSNFTIECWAYATSFPYYNSLTGSRANQSDAANTAYSFGIDSGGSVYFYSAGFLVTSSAGAIKLNSWNHIAIVRSGTGSNQSVLYINGVSAGTGTISNNLSGTSFAIGGLVNGDEPFTGYITNVRLNNTALYSTTFTPPTAPLTAVSGTSLLINTVNGAIFDNAMMNDLETVGNAQISTSVVKYGTGSMLLDGTGDYLAVLNTPSSTPNGMESWTIEGWIYKTATNAFKAIYVNGYPIQIFLDTDTIEVYVARSNSPDYIVSGLTGPASSITLNTWAHFAVVRNGNVYTVYVDGVGGSTTTSADAIAFPSNANATIGDAPIFGAYGYTGYIDDFRITKGYARYTANFTPPTSAFSNTGPY